MYLGLAVAPVSWYNNRNKEILQKKKGSIMNSKESPPPSTYNPQEFIQELDKKIAEIELIIDNRTKAAKRLESEGKWANRLNIYYSCFTATLSVMSIKTNSDFLTLPSAIFTVLLAILIIHASSQRFTQRAHDLRANCLDMQEKLLHIKYTISAINNNDTMNHPLETLINEISTTLALQKDSEYPASEDCGENNLPISIIILIITLFLIPIIFIIIYWNQIFLLFTAK